MRRPIRCLSLTPTTPSSLNADNEIVAAGNPVANPKVMDIYRKIISPEPTHINLLCRRPVATLGLISPADTVVRRFQLPQHYRFHSDHPGPHPFVWMR